MRISKTNVGFINRRSTQVFLKSCLGAFPFSDLIMEELEMGLRIYTEEQKAKIAVCDKSRNSSIRGIFQACKSGAKSRDISFEISLDDVKRLIKESGMRCAISGLPLTMSSHNPHKASIDRIDSDLGYTLGNIQVVSAMVNLMKNKHPQEMFLGVIHAIANNTSPGKLNNHHISFGREYALNHQPFPSNLPRSPAGL